MTFLRQFVCGFCACLFVVTAKAASVASIGNARDLYAAVYSTDAAVGMPFDVTRRKSSSATPGI